MGRYLSFISLVLSISGCSGSSVDTLKLDLFGDWKTQVCMFDQYSIFNDEGHWEEAVYSFWSNGDITKSRLIYNDSACSGTFKRIEPAADGVVAGNFADLGPAVLENGSGNGRRLRLYLYFMGDEYEYEGFYSIMDDKICFSDLFNFSVIAISASKDGSSDINYERCLVRGF